MTDAPAVVINLPGYPFDSLSSVATIAILRARASSLNANGDNIAVDGGSVIGDGLGGLYVWDAASVAADDGAATIRPTDKSPGQAGRYVLVGGHTFDAILAAATATASAAAAASALAAAASALTATNASSAAQTAAATAGVYVIGAASNVPKGLVGAAIANAGSGMTNGTDKVVTWASGNMVGNPVVWFDVVGGLMVNVRIKDPGLYIGASITLPTPTLPGAAGGAALTLTAGFLIGNGQGYWVQSADGLALNRYKNVAGVATADTAIGPIPTSAALDAAVAGFANVPMPLNDDALVGARASAVLPAAEAATVSGTHFTLSTSGANISVNLTGDQIGDTTTTVTATLQIVSGSAGTAFSTAIGRWYNSVNVQIGSDVALTKTAGAISFAGTQPSGAHSFKFVVTPPATTVCRFMTYQFGTPARPTTDAWYLSLVGAGVAANDPTPVSFNSLATNYDPLTGRVTVPATAGGFFYAPVPSGVNDGDVVWAFFDSPLEPTVWLQSVTARYGTSGGGGGDGYISQVLHVSGDRYAAALYVQSAADGDFYGPGWTWNNTGAATYFENVKLYVGPNPPFAENVSAIILKGIRDEIEAARIKPLITLADDSCGISSSQFQPSPGLDMVKFFGSGTKFQNFATPGNTLAQSASTVGLLPIHVSVSGGVIPASTSPVSITAWDQDPLTGLSSSNPEYDGYAYLCGVLGRVTAGSYSGNTPTSLFFTPVTAPDWPIDVPASSKLILRASRKRKGGLTLFPISSVNGTGGGGNSGSPFASVTAFVDAVFAANDPATIAGFVGLTASPYGTGQSQLTAFSAKSYYARLYNPNIMSAATVAEAMSLFGWTWTGTENADWLAGNIGIPGSMRWSGDGFHPYTDVASYVVAKNHFISTPVVSYLEAWA